MHGFIFFTLSIFISLNSLSASVDLFEYETQPNGGDQTIQGLNQGNQFLASFQYRVEMSQFTEGEVEVVFYNQFGQILHPNTIRHSTSNTLAQEEPVFFNSPTMPMFEGRTQLLAWARRAPNSQVTQSFPPDTTVILSLTSAAVACPGAEDPDEDPCEVTFNPPGLPPFSRETPRDGTTFVFAGNLPANTIVTLQNNTGSAIVRGQVAAAGPWFFGPHVFQGGNDSGEFIFIDSDQGPPASPFIDAFTCQGVSNCVDSPFLQETPRPSLDPETNRFRYKVVFNKRDIFNATNSQGSGVPLTLTYSGFVQNNPALWTDQAGNLGLPGANAKPESNAFVDSFLLPIRFTNSIAPEQATKTTGAGPYVIAVTGVNPALPQVVYPDDVNNHPYGSPIYPSAIPYPSKYPYPASLSPGLYQTFSYNFSNMIDGDYEIWVAAEDVVAAITQNGQSPGSVNASNQRVAGTTTVISIIKDGVPPNSFSVQLVPTDRYLILGDQADPPLPYDEFQGEIFQIRGTFSDERGDVLTMTFDLTRDDGSLIVRPGKDGHYEQVNTIGDFYSSFFDFTTEDPDTSGSPPPPHVATGGQRGYQMTVYPIDPQENVSETTQAIYIIKDLVAPQDPIFASPPTSTVVTSSFASILVSGFNVDLPSAPYLDLREHGLVSMNLSIIDSAGRASQFSTAGRSFIVSGAASSSKLDDNPAWNKPAGPFGGNGISGIDFFGEVPERYEFGQRFSLEDFAEGPITLIAQLTDQVGNSSNTTSITIIKNSTGPSVVFNDADRQNSGPDNNYPVPNFTGADDNNYIVSMISPELTVDFGPDGSAPTIADPGSIDSLFIEGLAIDAVTTINRVEVRSAHIPSVNASLQSTGFTVTNFDVNLDITGLIEGVREVVSFQAFDDSNIPGNPSSISIYRDTSPADPPIVLSPSKLPSDSVLRVYAASDRIRLSGRLSAKDSRILTISSGELLRSKVVALTPPEDPTSFSTGDQIPQIPKSSPQLVPRVDSFNSSLPQSDIQAHYDYVELDETGSWFFDLHIGNVPASYTAPTTIYLQAIDQFDNTDPNFSVTPIEVFYFPDGGLLQSLSIVDFRGSSQTIQIYPPDSLPPSVLETLFVGIENVKFELRTLIPMVEAPKLSLMQFLAETREASLLSSVDQVKGQTSFEYQYSVLAAVGKFDGRAGARVHGGLDLFGNSIREQLVSTAFYVDSLAPNIVTTGPLYIPREIQPLFDPPQGSRVNAQGVTISASFSDLLPSNGSLDRSGIDTVNSSLKIFGPLAESPEAELSIQSSITATGFEFSFQVIDIMKDGVYRMVLEAVDKLNNRHRFYSNIVFDETPIALPLLSTTPGNQSVISSIPLTGTTKYIDLVVERIDVNSSATNFNLRNPEGQLLQLGDKIILNQSSIRRYVISSIPQDGSSDGNYEIEISAVDLAGNAVIKVHEFLLDTTPPSSGRFFPGLKTCKSGTLNVFDLLVSDAPGREDIIIPTAGLDANSSLELRMLAPSYPLSERLTGHLFEGESQLVDQQEGNSTEELKLAFINSSDAQITSLKVDGTDDGALGLHAQIYDSVGNVRTTSSLFYYDTQAPDVKIEDFSDFRLIGVTSGFDLNIGGFISDEGPCHFNVTGEAYNGITTLELSIFNYDIDLESVTGVFIPTLAVDGLEAVIPTSFEYHSAQANWNFSTFVSFQGSLINQYYKLNLEVADQAGNSNRVSRIFQLVDHNMATPAIIQPPLESELDGQITTYRTGDQILSLRWQNIVGIERVEIEIYRPMLSSTIPIHKVTYPAAQQISDPLSLNMTLSTSEPSLIEVTDLEMFHYRIRGSDNSGRTSLWSRFYNLELDRRPLEIKQILVHQRGGISDLSSSGSFLSTPEFELEVIFNKRFDGDSRGVQELFVSDWQEKISLQPLQKTTLTTDRLYLQGSIQLRPMEDFPQERMQLHLSGYKDLVGQSMQVFDQSFAVDFGPDTRVQIFSNPVADEELISVIRLISHLGQLEPIIVRRSGGTVVSPSISIRKGFESKSLNPLPLNETTSDIVEGGVASIFSVPLQVSVSDVGFYFLIIDYEDQFGRVISKEKEISLGRLRSSKSFNLNNRSGAALSYGVVNSSEESNGLISMVEPVDISSKTSGTWNVFTNFDWLTSSESLRGLTMSVKLPSNIEAQITSHTVLIHKTASSWSYVRKISVGQSFVTTLGEQYFLAEDLHSPDLEWFDNLSLAPGWQVAPFDLWDSGSGLNWSSFRLTLDGNKLAWLHDGAQLKIEIPQLFASRKRDLDISVSDNSGRKLQSSRVVQVLAGTGIDWAYVVPNPVRESSMTLHYFLAGPAESGFVKVYDSSGNRVFQEELDPNPGKNQWNAELINSSGLELSNGAYFFKLEVKQNSRLFRRTGKFVILR